MVEKMLKIFATLAFLILAVSQCSGLTFRDKLHDFISKGNTCYHSNKHEDALRYYESAVEVDSSKAVPHFNAGDALYRLGKYEQGAREFSMAVGSQSDSIAAMSYYNLGNALFKAGNIPGAVEAYKRSLLIDPGDEDAKYNLELALNLLEQQKQQEKQEQKERQKENEQKGQQGKNEQQDKRKQEQQNKQNEQQQGGQNRAQADSSQAREKREPQLSEQNKQMQISQQELKRILAAIEASDREVQQELLKKKMRIRKITGKDW